jgi:hypothetical protein
MAGSRSNDHAQLSTLATSLAELTRRFTTMADDRAGGPSSDLAHELYEIERALQQAARRLDRLMRDLT